MPDKIIIPSNALHQAGMFLIEMTAQGTVIITGKEGMKIEPCGNNSIMLTPCVRYVPPVKPRHQYCYADGTPVVQNARTEL